MKATYNYNKEQGEFLNEIKDHLITDLGYGDRLVIDCENVRINGVKINGADCLYFSGNVTKVGIREVRPVVSGETGERIGTAQYIEPLAELWETTDGMRLQDLMFEVKGKKYHYILE